MIAAIHKVGEPHLIVHVEAQGGAVVGDDDFVGNRHRRLHAHRNGIALRVLHVEKAEHLYALERLNKIGGVLDYFRFLGLLGNFYHTRSEGTHYGKRCYKGKDMAFFKISKIHNEVDLMDCFYSLDAKGLEKVAREIEKNGNKLFFIQHSTPFFVKIFHSFWVAQRGLTANFGERFANSFLSNCQISP